jgi:hypothetical protein
MELSACLRLSNALQSRSNRIMSFAGSVSTVTCFAMEIQSSECVAKETPSHVSFRLRGIPKRG